MDSEKLSNRTRQPGHDQSYLESEENFIEALHKITSSEIYEIIPKPRELKAIFEGLEGESSFGVEPEALIRNKRTGRAMYFEVKKQGPNGNAEERAFKHHTVQFYKTLQHFTQVDYHAYCTIFCESLAVLPRYTTKFKYLIEPGQYFLWKDYEIAPLRDFILVDVCSRFLDRPGPSMKIDE